MPECRRCGCDIPSRRDCLFCGSDKVSDDLVKVHRLQSFVKVGFWLAVALCAVLFFTYIVPQLTYDPQKAMQDPRLTKARGLLRQGRPDEATRLLLEMKEDVWVSGLPDAFLASAEHLRYEQTSQTEHLVKMEEHLRSSIHKEMNLPYKYFAAIDAAEMGHKGEALELFSDCHNTLTSPARTWDLFLDRGQVNGNIAKWKEALQDQSTRRVIPTLHGL